MYLLVGFLETKLMVIQDQIRLKKSFVWSKTKGSSDIGQQFDGSVLDCFVNLGLSFAILQATRKSS